MGGCLSAYGIHRGPTFAFSVVPVVITARLLLQHTEVLKASSGGAGGADGTPAPPVCVRLGAEPMRASAERLQRVGGGGVGGVVGRVGALINA